MSRKMLVNIRPIEEEDIIFLNRWKNDSEIFKYLGGGFRPVSISEQKKWINELISMSGNNLRFMIHPLEIEHPVGMIGLYSIHSVNRTAELGLYLGEKNYQGKGIAQIAYNEIENYAKSVLNLRKIKLYVVSENLRAISFFERNNFIKTGILKNERFIEGSFVDVLMYEKFLRIEDKYEY